MLTIEHLDNRLLPSVTVLLSLGQTFVSHEATNLVLPAEVVSAIISQRPDHFAAAGYVFAEDAGGGSKLLADNVASLDYHVANGVELEGGFVVPQAADVVFANADFVQPLMDTLKH